MPRNSFWNIVLSVLLVVPSWLTCCAGASAAATASHQELPAGLEKVASDAASGLTEYRLKSNGLQVLLAERHATPIVMVMVVFHVGSRNEAVGYTGSTHFLEHMGFKGTAKHDPLKGTGLDDVLKPTGGMNNATTWYDRTNYFEIVPARHMGLCLELEADRMRHELLRESDRRSEMTVVRNELERREDDPGSLLETNLFATAFREHPYHHPVIGWRSDVENVPTERLRQFYNDFYYPNNATLVVVGDFQSRQALADIDKYFAPLPASPHPFPRVYTTEPPQEGERRFVVRRGEGLPKVMIGFHIPKATARDTYPLDVMASLLGDNSRQSSRLYKSLIDSGLASDCYANNVTLRDPGLFMLCATATPGTSLPALEAKMLAELDRLGHEPVPADELERAKKADWKRMKLGAADPAGMAEQLAEAIAVADWRWWLGLEKNIKAVTGDGVKQAAARYFSERNRTVGYYYPKAAAAADEKAENTGSKLLALVGVEASTCATAGGASSAHFAVDAGKQPFKHATIASQVLKRVLPNGLTVLVMPVPGSGVVAVAGKTLAGNYFRDPNLTSVPDLMSELLNKGSAGWSKEALAQQLENLGTTLEFGTGNFWLEFESEVVSEDLPVFLPLAADVLEKPLFLETELAKSIKIKDAELQQALSNTRAVAANAFYSSVYKPSSVYFQRPFKDQIEELKQIKAADLVAFHKSQVTPANTILAVVGDIDSARAFDLVAANFGSWSGPPATHVSTAGCAATVSDVPRRLERRIADKTNVDVFMGVPTDLSIKSPDFYAASIANAALGHDTISSRLAAVRTEHGFTYGISSGFAEIAYPGAPWLIGLSVNPKNLVRALPLVTGIVENYRKGGITAKELKNESGRLAGEFVVQRMRTPSQLAVALTRYEMLGLGAKFMDEYPQHLQSVTDKQVDAAINKYFRVSKMVTSIAGSLPVPGTPAR